ncbi:hypothetical protein B0H10DRAFT_2234356 [Mycena sp. CBHHK59/15]|nr:hypothetical protein B0H10DRAFT_2234356 [Mycena sp. CBHHK59/15]
MAPLPDVHLSYGPMLIGVFFNMILYGVRALFFFPSTYPYIAPLQVFIGQVLTYYQICRKDGAWMRYFVLYLFVLETLNTGFDMAMMYQPLILQYGEQLDYFPTVFITEPMMVVLVSTPIQIFFAWRIWTITKMVWVPVIITVFAIAALAGGLWTAAKVGLIKEFIHKPELHTSALLWFLSSCVADVLITISLVMTLSSRKTGFVATDSVIDKIIRTTIQTGLITCALTIDNLSAIAANLRVYSSVFSILDVVCFMVFPHYAINFVWDLALSKLYSNALLSTLNARSSLASISTSRPTGSAAGQGSHPGTQLNLVFEDMALVMGTTPVTTKAEPECAETSTDNSEITETPRSAAGFMLYSGGSSSTRGLDP